MEQSRIAYLTERYLSRTASESERWEFFELVRLGKDNEQIREVLMEGWHSFATAEKIPETEADKLFDSIMLQADRVQQPGRIVAVKHWTQLVAAASVIFLLGVGIYFLFLNRSVPDNHVVKIPASVKDIAAPVGSKASIVLANGQVVFLDSMPSGTLAVQGDVKVIKNKEGEIVYSGASGEEVYNTLYNPRGSKAISVTLSDGTRVWLNAESSLKYPAAFVGNERKVVIAGEAYFEVAHHERPFEVSVKGMVVTVLGTHFNVNAYDDEESMKTSLLQGSVRVELNNSLLLLYPGQQAQALNEGKIKLNKNVDLDEVVAWKNGLFSFNRADINAVMRQISRWYNVDVSFTGAMPEGTYDGAISRDAPLSKILEILKVAGIKFNIEGNKLIVTGN